MTKGVFSEFEVRKQYLKLLGVNDATFEEISCVGSAEEELEVKTITKNCRGVIAKRKTKGTGSGTLTESLHVPRAIYNKIYDMMHTELKTGVYAYGQGSTHPEFALTMQVFDEDDEVKLKAYPRCIIESGPHRPITNGAEEVAELELTISLLPDENGYCMYEALVTDIDETTAKAWLTNFSTELVTAGETTTPTTSGSGSTGSTVFTVTVTLDSEDPVGIDSVDKTYAEIEAAYQAGNIIMFTVGEVGTVSASRIDESSTVTYVALVPTDGGILKITVGESENDIEVITQGDG